MKSSSRFKQAKAFTLKDRERLPNGLTLFRMLGGALLLFFAPESLFFLLLYALCCLSDALDGFLARKWGCAGEKGARLDTLADILLLGVLILKLGPLLLSKLPMLFYLLTGTVLLLRLSAYAVAAVKFKRFLSLHTRLNKLTGLLLSLVPFIAGVPWLPVYCWGVLGVSALSAMEELLIEILSACPKTDGASLFLLAHGKKSA